VQFRPAGVFTRFSRFRSGDCGSGRAGSYEYIKIVNKNPFMPDKMAGTLEKCFPMVYYICVY
jgi:hypothetical protein